MAIKPDLAVRIDSAIAEIEGRLRRGRDIPPPMAELSRWASTLADCREALAGPSPRAAKGEGADNG